MTTLRNILTPLHNFRQACRHMASTVILLIVLISPATTLKAEETVSLTMGQIDTNLYGRNFGRNGNTQRLDVTVTQEQSGAVELLWVPYSTSTAEMSVFLNDQQIQVVGATGVNQLGSLESFVTEFIEDDNGFEPLTFSFRVSGGDQTWGIANLAARFPPNPSTGEPEIEPVFEEPGPLGFSGGNTSQALNFDFQPKGVFFTESVTISFDALLKSGTTNGFNVRLNGQTILNVATFVGNASNRSFSTTVDASVLSAGSNSLTISTTSNNAVFNFETTISNINVESTALPGFDLSVSPLNVIAGAKPVDPIVALVNVLNIGQSTSGATDVTFMVSDSSDMSNPETVATASVAALPGQDFSFTKQEIDSPLARKGKYLWACVNHLADDINAGNDCSAPVQIDVSSTPAVAPANFLLLSD